MTKYNSSFLVLSLWVYISLVSISSAEYVPVYLWATTHISDEVPALERLPTDTFRKILETRAGKDIPIVVFAESTLSTEDFVIRDSNGKSPFTHLSRLEEYAKHRYWTFVKNPMKAITGLSNRNIIETPIKSVLEDESFQPHNNDIVIVNLNDAHDGEDRLQMLQRHDKYIFTVYKKLVKEESKIITLFTGYHSSWITPDEIISRRQIRDTDTKEEPKPEPPKDTYKIYNNSDVTIYVTSTPSLHFNGTMVSLADFTISTSGKNETGMTVTFASELKKDITVDFDFMFEKGYWKIVNIKVHNESLKEESGKDYLLRAKDVYAPMGFSYHCNSQTFYHDSNKLQNLSMPGLQVQPFSDARKSDKFGDAYDCVGFTTAPIWSGLFVTFILALIMTFGLTMMMDIKTMDRFDDPKGKTITIGAIE